MKRDNQGRLILDDFKKLNNYIAGRKEKIWLEYNDRKYLFKTGASNYEVYAEIIAAELAKQCGFKAAEYDVAVLDGKTGVITPSFLKNGDIIISGHQYLENAKAIAIQNNIGMDFRENSVENILNALALQEVSDDAPEVILFRLIQMWCFDIAIMESDRNNTNWSLIRKMNGSIELAPIYDCSTMARMNTDIENLLHNLRYDYQVYDIIDSIQYSLKLNNNGHDNYYEDFEYLCLHFQNEIEDIIYSLDKMDIDKAINDITNRINADLNDPIFEIPYVVNLWLNKVIGTRVTTMKKIFENSKKKSSIKF